MLIASNTLKNVKINGWTSFAGEYKLKAITEGSSKCRQTKSGKKILNNLIFFFLKRTFFWIRVITCNENSCHESLHDKENNIKIYKTSLLEI